MYEETKEIIPNKIKELEYVALTTDLSYQQFIEFNVRCLNLHKNLYVLL